MDQSPLSRARRIARAASAFEQRLTGRVPRSVAVVLGGDTLVITLHGPLSKAEQEAARSPAGAAQVQEFHRQLFDNSLDALRREITQIAGVEVREASAGIDPDTGTVVRAFATGTLAQVFLLAGAVDADTWSGPG